MHSTAANREADARRASDAPNIADALALLSQQQLRASAEIEAQSHLEARLFRSALNSIPRALCIFDAGGRVFFANHAFSDIYRLPSPAELMGLPFDDLVARQALRGTIAEAPDAWPLQARSALERGEAVASDIGLADGRSVHVGDYPMQDGGWISTHIDLTIAAHGDALALRRLSLQGLIDLVPDNLWVKDAESRFVIANDATARQIGLGSSRDLIGKSDLDVHPPEHARLYIEAERKVIESGRSLQDLEEFVSNENGGVWVLTTKLPMRDSSGEVIGLLGISRDITARKLAERFRNDQAAILEMIAIGAPLGETLERLALLLEGQIAGVGVAIRHGTEDNRQVLFGSAAALPAAFLAAAADESDAGETLIVREVDASAAWAACRELAAATQIRCVLDGVHRIAARRKARLHRAILPRRARAGRSRAPGDRIGATNGRHRDRAAARRGPYPLHGDPRSADRSA